VRSPPFNLKTRRGLNPPARWTAQLLHRSSIPAKNLLVCSAFGDPTE
jgi:hypothetical protein